MSRSKHVYAMFTSKDDAVAAYRELQAGGCPAEHCSMILHEGKLAESDLGPVESASHEGVWKGAAVGGAAGALITGLVAASGGLLGVGFLTGLAVGGGLMAIYGAIFGGIAGSDDAARHVRALERALEEGEVLFAAKIDDPERAGTCQEILNAHGGRSIEVAAADRPAPPLSPSEQADLLAALDDEYRETATYSQVLADFGDVRPFASIVESERRHADAVARLLQRHGVPVPENTWPDRVPRYGSLQEACEAAVAAEIENGALYERLLAGTTRPDLLGVYRHLQEASQQRHLPALRQCAEERRR
jgi:rubrerythrin